MGRSPVWKGRHLHASRGTGSGGATGQGRLRRVAVHFLFQGVRALDSLLTACSPLRRFCGSIPYAPSMWMVVGWHMPSKVAISPPTVKTPESEKITINMGFVDLGHIDLLVAEGFYSNRTDFIRTAIRTHL